VRWGGWGGKARCVGVSLKGWGGGAGPWGAGAAGRHYFRTPASRLGAADAALLAGALINPNRYSPANPPPRLRRRQQMILSLLRKVHDEKLSKEATQAAIQGLMRDIFTRMESSERKAFYDAQVDGNTKMILTAIKIATPKQKAHAQKRMQGWIDDLNTLARETQK